MTLRAHLTPTVVAVAVTSALVGGGTAYGVTTLIDGHRLVNHTVDAWKLTAAAQQYLRGRTGATGPGLFSPSGYTGTMGAMLSIDAHAPNPAAYAQGSWAATAP